LKTTVIAAWHIVEPILGKRLAHLRYEKGSGAPATRIGCLAPGSRWHDPVATPKADREPA